jgi:hypothetical protein
MAALVRWDADGRLANDSASSTGIGERTESRRPDRRRPFSVSIPISAERYVPHEW